MHLSLEEFKISLNLFSSTQSLCRTVSPAVEVQVFLVSELESESHKNTRTLHPCCSLQVKACIVMNPVRLPYIYFQDSKDLYWLRPHWMMPLKLLLL